MADTAGEAVDEGGCECSLPGCHAGSDDANNLTVQHEYESDSDSSDGFGYCEDCEHDEFSENGEWTEYGYFLEWPHNSTAHCICADSTLASMDFDDFYNKFRPLVDMDDDELRDYHSRLWEHQGLPLNWHEDGLANGYDASRKPGRAGLKYESCTLSEIRTIFAARGLQDPYPSGSALCPLYLRLLDDDDEKQTFRFMDLPPELRIHVCRMLLSAPDKRNRRRCWDVAILRACKQVYEEAKHILYTDNVISVGCQVNHWGGGVIDNDAYVHNDRGESSCSRDLYFNLPRAIDVYPNFLRRIQRLKIRLQYNLIWTNSGDVPNRWVALNHFLYALSSFLMEGHRLKYLSIRLDFPEQMADWGLDKCLYPLHRLRNVPNLKIIGRIPSKVADSLKRELSNSEPTFNTLRRWMLLGEEAVSQQNLLKAVSDFSPTNVGCPLKNRSEHIELHLRLLQKAVDDRYIHGEREEGLLARLGRMKKYLGQMTTADLMAKVCAFVESHKASQQYEETMDDGRLEEAMKALGADIYEQSIDL